MALRARADDVETTWGCRGCRSAIVKTMHAQRDDRAARADAIRMGETLVATLTRITELPRDVADRLRTEAAGGPLPSRPGSPLYNQRLARLIATRL